MLVGPQMATQLMFVKEASDGTLTVMLDVRTVGRGTFDAATRKLHVVPVSVCGLGTCCVVAIDATVSADGGTMSGSVTHSTPGFYPPNCGLPTDGFTATRMACGNGVVDSGESCDPADLFSEFDCCSSECALEPADRTCELPEIEPCGGSHVSSKCDGTSAVCPPRAPADEDGDGIPDFCDHCSRGSGLRTLRVHRRRAAVSIAARLAVEPGFDPVAKGMDIFLEGEPSDRNSPLIYELGDPGRWTVKRPGRSWRFRTSGRKPDVTARVRFAHGVAAVRARIADISEITRLRFVTVEYAFQYVSGPPAVCGDADLASSACVVRRQTTVCRAELP